LKEAAKDEAKKKVKDKVKGQKSDDNETTEEETTEEPTGEEESTTEEATTEEPTGEEETQPEEESNEEESAEPTNEEQPAAEGEVEVASLYGWEDIKNDAYRLKEKAKDVLGINKQNATTNSTISLSELEEDDRNLLEKLQERIKNNEQVAKIVREIRERTSDNE